MKRGEEIVERSERPHRAGAAGAAGRDILLDVRVRLAEAVKGAAVEPLTLPAQRTARQGLSSGEAFHAAYYTITRGGTARRDDRKTISKEYEKSTDFLLTG